MFLTLLPAQVFPETVDAVFVSRPLPEPAVHAAVSDEAENKTKRALHGRKALRSRD
jgi:hypothetical protein